MIEPDYGAIIKRSWEITWKNKWLWVVGLVLGAFGGGGSNYNYSGSGSSSSSTNNLPNNLPKDLPKETSEVLGAATDYLKNWFSQIPVTTWILLGLVILLIVIIFMVVSLVIVAWAKGALITGLKDADEEKEVNLKTMAPSGIASMKNLIILNLISLGLTIALVIGSLAVVGLPGLVLSVILPVLGTIWFVIAGIAVFLTFMVLVFLFAVLTIYADRLIVLKGYSAWEAWKKGFNMGKKQFIPTLVMGLINNCLGCGAGCLAVSVILIVLGIPAFIIAAPMFANGFQFPALWQIICGLVILFLGIYSMALVTAIMIVFRYGTWNLLFKEIMKQEELTNE
jgi:hypothetical protein